ncbi:hypothetical protein H6P81_005599 [Aristolochia fimbriata]|uniref:Photosystem II 11 kDa protein n=1 Tax=Aristolochia fimbriata TaxID=158543 RepID=A0AAV7EX38_ARIFI|nr:hypothetical protein H6P81_005599 [Aristolochia fimbriata]
MAGPSLLSPNAAAAAATTTTSKPPSAFVFSKSNGPVTGSPRVNNSTIEARQYSMRSSATSGRRDFLKSSIILGGAAASSSSFLFPIATRPASAASDDEYTKETTEVIGKVRSTINMDKTDPNVASAVADLREASNYWVAKYRKEKALLGRASFRDLYSALNAVSGHYISFGPTAPIPAKRKARILEEMDTAEKALLRGR